jgi:prevent-host-death family protein
VSAAELKTNLGKYLLLVANEEIVITKSGKNIAKLSGIKQDKEKEIESLFGSVPWNGEDIDIKTIKAERLVQKDANFH